MSITNEQLVGAWNLVSWHIDYQGRRPDSYPFGEDAEGLLIYDAGGWMSATMSCRERTNFSAGSARQASAESRARAVEEYLAYCARWWIAGRTVVHDVVLSLNPTLMHTHQIREATLDGDRLLLCAHESGGSTGGARTHRLLWQRAQVVRPPV